MSLLMVREACLFYLNNEICVAIVSFNFQVLRLCYEGKQYDTSNPPVLYFKLSLFVSSQDKERELW